MTLAIIVYGTGLIAAAALYISERIRDIKNWMACIYLVCAEKNKPTVEDMYEYFRYLKAFKVISKFVTYKRFSVWYDEAVEGLVQ